MLDLKTFRNPLTKTINENQLITNIERANPNLIVISICYSQVSEVKVILERPGVLAQKRLERNLISATNGKAISLDENQIKLIYQVAHPDNINKNVVIHGPEGSGKTYLGIEIVKLLFYNYIYTKKLTPTEIKTNVRVIFSTCEHGMGVWVCVWESGLLMLCAQRQGR